MGKRVYVFSFRDDKQYFTQCNLFSFGSNSLKVMFIPGAGGKEQR